VIGDLALAADHPSNRRLIAHHEAGHCVAMLAVGAAIGRASLEPSAVTYAVRRTWSGRFDSGAERMAAARFIKIALSGPIAEACFAGRRADAEACRTDITDARRLALGIGGGSRPAARAFLLAVYAEASELIPSRWTDVEHVAELLLEHGAMSGAEIEEAVRALDCRPDSRLTGGLQAVTEMDYR
jgi:hypothetical protein